MESPLSIHERLHLIETSIAAANNVAGGVADLVDLLHKHAPTPATVVPAHSADVLSRNDFQAAMVQQAKDFGYAIEEIRTRLKAVEETQSQIVSSLEAIAKQNAPQT